MTQEEAKYIWKLMPDWVKEQPEGLGHMFYGTLTREGDLEVAKKVKNILKIKE